MFKATDKPTRFFEDLRRSELNKIWEFAQTLGCTVPANPENWGECADLCTTWLNENVCEKGSRFVWWNDDYFLAPIEWLFSEDRLFEAKGVMCLSNTGGIEIDFDRSNDTVFYRFAYGQEVPDVVTEAQIDYQQNPDLDETENDENGPFACFVVGEGENETIYFLSDFVRTL